MTIFATDPIGILVAFSAKRASKPPYDFGKRRCQRVPGHLHIRDWSNRVAHNGTEQFSLVGEVEMQRTLPDTPHVEQCRQASRRRSLFRRLPARLCKSRAAGLPNASLPASLVHDCL